MTINSQHNFSYDSDLPKATVIIVFYNEGLSVLLRAIWSILDRTPEKYLKEIIVYDDGSNTTELLQTLPRYIQHRLSGKVSLKERCVCQIGLRVKHLIVYLLVLGWCLIYLLLHGFT